jgi:hypothetical protein
MTEFCDTCPLRGEAIGCITRMYMVNEIAKQNDNGEWINTLGNPVGVLIDEENNISEPFKIPDDTDNVFERVEKRIQFCENHLSLQQQSFFNRIIPQKKGCPAVGELAIKGWGLKKAIRKHVLAQVL